MVRLEYAPFHVLVAMGRQGPLRPIEDACNHVPRSCQPIRGEPCDGACVSCPMHGYIFELSTGRLVAPRGLCGDQRRFVARVDGHDVVVWDPGFGITVVGA